MRLILERPHKHAKNRRFPPEAAYLCFTPDKSTTMNSLINMTRNILGEDQTVRLAVIRPYKTRNHVANIEDAESLISSSAAEAYALIPCEDAQVVQKELEAFDFDEESTLVRRFGGNIVAFFHHGHHSVEFVGNPEQIKRAIQCVLDTCSSI